MKQTSDNLTNKAALRKALLVTRCAIAQRIRTLSDAAICEYLFDWWSSHPVQVLGIYWPMQGEPDLRNLYGRLASGGVRLALPVVVARDAPLRFVEWMPGDVLVKDGMGVSVPVAEAAVLSPEALLIPCLGFNDRGFRLGYGGGFYDRTLAVMSRPVAIGIAYSCLKVDFENDPHDVAMDRVITEIG